MFTNLLENMGDCLKSARGKTAIETSKYGSLQTMHFRIISLHGMAINIPMDSLELLAYLHVEICAVSIIEIYKESRLTHQQ